jgi:DNA-binding transcriptional ArsR family regulator
MHNLYKLICIKIHMKKTSYHNFFTNLANKTKLDILLALQESPLNVTDLTKKINGEQSNISHHLKHLSDCKLISSKQQGKQRIYSLNTKTISPILKLVETHAKKHCSDGCTKNCPGCGNEKNNLLR